MIYAYFKKLFYVFEDYKKPFIKYSLLSAIASVLELFGVALIYPFVLKLLSSSADKNKTLMLGVLIVALFLLKNIFMIFYTYIQADFLSRFELMMQKRIVNFFLSSGYEVTSKIPLAQKGKILFTLILQVKNNFILRLLNLNINILIFVAIAGLIAVKFPLATVLSVLSAIILIKIQNSIFKPLLTKISKRISEDALANNQAYNEALLDIKSVKISNNEKYFYDNYSKSLAELVKNYKKMSFLTQVPPYITEPFAIILLFILLAVITCQNIDSPEKLIASFALVAAAIFRLTPTFSRIQTNINGINSAFPMVKEFIDFYEKYDIKNVVEVQNKDFSDFVESIELKDICFEYEQDRPVLKNINLKINKGEFIGMAGLSGVGKTTLADLIAGLCKPQKGQIFVDGKELNKPLKIGYIPQQFTLISGSIKDNVAFGNSDVDEDRIIDALKKAQIYDFIIENYPEGINSKPFTDSLGLSQGQKQRLAIARALYSNSDLLILDEATSSLDLKTEEEICNVLNELKGQKTIIVIAHRLSTIKDADKIIFMENGTIAAVGNFDELSKLSETFKKLVEIGNTDNS